MKRFWYKFLVCVLSLGMLYPTWIATGVQKAKAWSDEIIVNNSDAEFTTTGGSWIDKTDPPSAAAGAGYMDDITVENEILTGRTARWTPVITTSGLYQVFAYYSVGTGRPTAVPYSINHNGDVDVVYVDQTKDATGVSATPGNNIDSGWNPLGTYEFQAGTVDYIEIDDSSPGNTCADAVKFVHTNVLPTAPELSLPADGSITKETAIDFSWLPSTDEDDDDAILTYDFEFYMNNVLDTTNSENGISGTNKSVTGLVDGDYKWRARSFDLEGYSVWSEYYSFTVDTTIVTAPAAPTNLTVIAGNGEASLTWDPVTDADYYNVYYQKTSDSAYTGPIAVVGTTTKITNLENGTSYRFIVRAVKSSVESADSWLEATPTAPEPVKVVLASAPTVQDAVVAQPETPAVMPEVTPPTEETGPEIGQIKGEETAATEEEDINWTPWIILFVLIVLAGAATGGYFYWFGNEEEEIVSEKVIEKTRKSNGKKSSGSKPSAKKSKRW